MRANFWESVANNPLGEPTTGGCGEEKAEGKKRDVPNYLERKPGYFDEEKGERMTRNKTRNATTVQIEAQTGEKPAP